MFARLLVPLALTLVLLIALFGAHRYWLYEEPRATGPLAEALLASVDPDEERQILNDVVAAAYIDPQSPIIEREVLLESNGFDAAISPANVAGSKTLSCRRPIEGRHYCDRFNLYVYQTAAGEIIESLVATYHVLVRDRVFGRCPYNPPSAEN